MRKYSIVYIIGLVFLIFGIDFFTVSGTYFFLDTIFYPKQSFVPFFEQTLYWHFIDLGTSVLGYKLFTKICFLSIILTGSLLGIQIANIFCKLFQRESTIQKTLFTCISISFILLNPFIYERFLTQTHIVLGIFFIGLGSISLLNFILYNKNKEIYISALFFGLSLSIFPHAIIFLLIIALTSLSFYWKNFSIFSVITSLGIVFLININWLIGQLFHGKGNGIEKVSTFNFENIQAFQSNSLSGLGVEITNLLLYGFWGERYNHLYSPDVINQKWYIAGAIILAIIIYGGYILYQKNKKLTLYLSTLFGISYILSLGISSDIFSGINMFLYNNLPYYTGMREPQKLTGMVMILYSIFLLGGIYGITELFTKHHIKEYLDPYIGNPYFGSVLIIAIIVAWSPNVLFGFNGQLKVSDYPKEFIQVRNLLLDKQSNQSKSVIFPWHSYIACPWTHGKVVSNVGKGFLSPVNTVSSDNIEIASLYTNNINNLESQEIERFLKEKNYNRLKKIGIDKIIMLNKCADYEKYNYLDEDSGINNNFSLRKSYSSEYISIYDIK